MQHHAAHMGVVEVQHVTHLAVGERRIEQAELELAPEHGCRGLPEVFLQHAEQCRDGAVPEPASAHPIQSSTPRRASRFAAAEVAELVRRRDARTASWSALPRRS